MFFIVFRLLEVGQICVYIVILPNNFCHTDRRDFLWAEKCSMYEDLNNNYFHNSVYVILLDVTIKNKINSKNFILALNINNTGFPEPNTLYI